jgi:hypothetical protein
MRVHLSNAVANLIDDLGPKVFENFDEVLSIVPFLTLCLMLL